MQSVTQAGGIPQEVVVLLDMGTRKERLRLVGHRPTRRGGIAPLAFSPDGQVLASAGHDDAIILWDLATAKPLRRVSTAPHSLLHLAFSPEGRTLAGGDHQIIRLWNASTGRPLLEAPEAHRGNINQVLFLPDGRTLVTASNDRTIRFWDVATSRQRLVLTGHGYWVRAIAVSPDGTTLASSSFDNSVRLWDIATAREIRKRWGHGEMGGGQRALAFTRDGKTLASWGDYFGIDNPWCWDVPSGRRVPRPPGLPVPRGTAIGRVSAISPDGNLAFGHHEFHSYLLDQATGDELSLPEGSSAAYNATFSPDGKIVAAETGTLARGTVRLWETATGEVIRTLEGPVSASSFAFSPDGRRLAAGLSDTTALLWELWPRPTRPSGPLTPQVLEELWFDLSRRMDAGKAYAAIWALADVPEQSVPLLRSRLTPSTEVIPEPIRKLIADLDTDRFAVREAAMRELQKLGDEATPALRRALSSRPSAELRRRVLDLLGPSRFVEQPEELRRLRAVVILERIGSKEARQVLAALATGAPEDRLTQEAKASLERIAKQPAASP
jgi:WD40 repeat protein